MAAATRVRHRAEMHGDVLGLRDHPSRLVEDRPFEQSRRSLMFAEKRRGE